MRREKDSRKTMLWILLTITIILALALIFILAVKPGVQKYVFNKQVEAANIITNNFYTDMITQLQNQGYYQVTIGEQTIVLVPYQNPGA